MKSIFRSLVAIAALACVSAICYAGELATSLVTAARTSSDRIRHLVLDAFQAVAQSSAAVRDAVVLIVAAMSFVQRIVRRERLQVTSTWRLCPSV